MMGLVVLEITIEMQVYIETLRNQKTSKGLHDFLEIKIL